MQCYLDFLSLLLLVVLLKCLILLILYTLNLGKRIHVAVYFFSVFLSFSSCHSLWYYFFGVLSLCPSHCLFTCSEFCQQNVHGNGSSWEAPRICRVVLWQSPHSAASLLGLQLPAMSLSNQSYNLVPVTSLHASVSYLWNMWMDGCEH